MRALPKPSRFSRRQVLLLLGLVLAAEAVMTPPPAWLRGILQRTRRRYGGRVLDVKLKRKKGRAWYEIRLLDRYDRVRTLRVPASVKRRNFNDACAHRGRQRGHSP